VTQCNTLVNSFMQSLL